MGGSSSNKTTMCLSYETWKRINDKRRPGETMEQALLKLIENASKHRERE